MPRKPSKDPRPAPSRTRDGRENQLISLATQLAEKQLREGTATSQVITHFLKLGTTREQLEQEKLARENKLLDAKVEQIAAAERIEGLYAEALAAMKTYAGREEPGLD